MRLTQRTDLALRALIFLSARWPESGTVNAMATALEVSAHHLMKSVQDLRHGGFVESARGYAGGHRLVREPKKIRVGDVVRALEQIALVECFRDRKACVLTPECTLADAFRRASDAFLAVLDGVTLADISKRRTAALLRLRPSLQE